MQGREGLETADESCGGLFRFPGFDGAIVRRRMVELIVGVISWGGPVRRGARHANRHL
jgi:hypothetical protein